MTPCALNVSGQQKRGSVNIVTMSSTRFFLGNSEITHRKLYIRRRFGNLKTLCVSSSPFTQLTATTKLSTSRNSSKGSRICWYSCSRSTCRVRKREVTVISTVFLISSETSHIGFCFFTRDLNYISQQYLFSHVIPCWPSCEHTQRRQWDRHNEMILLFSGTSARLSQLCSLTLFQPLMDQTSPGEDPEICTFRYLSLSVIP